MRADPATVMIYAAGFGTRMGPLTRTLPKPLIEVAGTALLDRALALAEAAGVKRRIVNTHYRAADIEAHLAGRDVTLSHEWPDILDTGGGLRQALPLVAGEDVFTLNPDTVWSGPNPLRTLAAAWQPARMGACLLLVPHDLARGHLGAGDFSLAPDGRLTRGGPLVYTGAQVLRAAEAGRLSERVFSLNRVWDLLESEGRLFGTLHPGGWCDVGHPGGIAEAEALLAEAGDV